MASEDVIELGSSDEDAEPASKKASTGKRRPNAMVQFPPGLTIKSSKPVSQRINPISKLIRKGLTVKKVNSSHRHPSNIRNGGNLKQALPVMPQIQNIKTLGRQDTVIPMQVKNTTVVNPFLKVNNPLPMAQGTCKFPVKVVPNMKALTVVPTKTLIKSGPSIAVTKISNLKPQGLKPTGSRISAAKRPATISFPNLNKKQKTQRITPKQVATVNLDDEDIPTTSTASHQWYLRPEDSMDMVTENDPLSTAEPSMENKNNAEPSNFVEITIEDSPIKPVSNKRTHEVGAELSITVDDSPIKTVATKPTNTGDSDNEIPENSPKERHSKKRLEYSKDLELPVNFPETTIEIELEPLNTAGEVSDTMIINDDTTSNGNIKVTSVEPAKKNDDNLFINDSVIEIIESPAKTMQTPPCTPKKDTSRGQKPKAIELAPETSQSSEFHPVYQEFIDLCFKLENSNDMQIIVEKKIKNYYRQVPKEYTESEDFVDLVQSKIFAMKAGPEKLYLYIKDIVDELNLQRKMAKTKPPSIQETRTLEAEKFQYGEDSEFDSKRQRQIRKLEKTLKKLHRAIQKLEEQEVDFDDEEDSVYLLTERYKERMVRVHTKFCQLTNTKMPSEPRIQIQQRPGQPAGPAKRLEKWINRKVPIGTPLPFPDFHDVLKCVRDANSEDKLGWNEADIMEEARDLFIRCGKKLQRRRQENEWRLAASRIPMETDPAENSEELKKKLESNKQMASKKETDVFNKFADKQSQLKLEAVEIGDKEADESPVESEDEEPHEEEPQDNLVNKEKRKERLRRLIQEKSKKNDSKDIEPKNDLPGQEITVKEDGGNDIDKDSEMIDKTALDSIPEGNKDKNDMEVDVAIKDKNDEQLSSKGEVLSISGDSKIDSEIDELHLLQKLHSDAVNSSTADSTDSETPIDISDSLSSDNKKTSSDVISIENSSYSETEMKDMEVCLNTDSTEKDADKNTIKIAKDVNIPDKLSHKPDCSAINKTNNEEYNESVESILLASTDEENDDNEEIPKNDDECVNVKDDAITISETTVEQAKDNSRKEIVVSNESKITSSNEADTSVCEELNTSNANSTDNVSSSKNSSKEDITMNREVIEKEINSTEVKVNSEQTIENIPPVDPHKIKDTDICSNKYSQERDVDKNIIRETENEDVPSKKPDELECSTTDKTNNEEYNESVESIMLPSTDEEDNDKDESFRNNDECVNLKDDAISIGETMVEQTNTLRKETSSKNKFVSNSEDDINVCEEIKVNIADSKKEESSNKSLSIKVTTENGPVSENREQATDDISSVETLESDNSQEALKQPDVVMTDAQLDEENPHRVEEAVEENKDDVLTELDKGQSKSTDNPLITLESDNSQELTKEKCDVIEKKSLETVEP